MSSGNKRKNFYIAQDVLPHLSKQPNKSYYINELIRRDIKNFTVLTKEDVIRLIKEYLSHRQENVGDFSNSINNILKGE